MDFEEFAAILATAHDRQSLFDCLVNAPFSNPMATAYLGLGIIVLLLVDAAKGVIQRMALSDTPAAMGAVRMSAKPFHDIRIPISYPHNVIAKAIRSGERQQTTDWKHLFIPDLTPQDARMNQAGAGIECSVVYPLPIQPGGAFIFSFYEPPEAIGEAHHAFMRRYVQLASEQLAKLKMNNLFD